MFEATFNIEKRTKDVFCFVKVYGRSCDRCSLTQFSYGLVSNNLSEYGETGVAFTICKKTQHDPIVEVFFITGLESNSSLYTITNILLFHSARMFTGLPSWLSGLLNCTPCRVSPPHTRSHCPASGKCERWK